MPLAYPPTPKSPAIDDYHGNLVPDPYRWLKNADVLAFAVDALRVNLNL